MIVVINSLGGLVSIQDEDLHQGSTKLNKIDLVAPFADNVIFKANFEMPDGTIKPDDLDGYLFQPSMKIVDNFNVWKLPITFPITQDYGIVTMQLRGYIGDTVVCTTSIKLPIQKGVPYASNFEELSDKDQLLQMIADLKALLNTKVDKINYALKEAGDVTENTKGIYFVYDDETEQYVSKTLPQDYAVGVTYYQIANTGKVINMDDELYLEYTDNATNKSVKLKIDKDKITLNDKQVVVFNDLQAKNITYDNSVTEMKSVNTQQALDELLYRLEELRFSQSIDLGKITLPASGWKEVDGIYQYEFTNEKFTNASIQSVVITPNQQSIDLLNKAGVLIYPEIDVYQKDVNVAVAIIKADSKITFDVTANFQLSSVKPNTEVNEIKASMITFVSSENIDKNNVQEAINKVQSNLNDLKNTYNDEKTNFAILNEDGKLSESQIPVFVKDVYEGSFFEGDFYTDSTHTVLLEKMYGKIYIDYNLKTIYFWNGSWKKLNSYDEDIENITEDIEKITENIENITEDIEKITNGTTKVKKSENADNADNATNADNAQKINNIEITQDENGILKVGDIIIPQKKKIWTGEFWNNDSSTYKELDVTYQEGDILELEYRLVGGGNATAKANQYFRFKVDSTAGNYIYICNVVNSDFLSIKIDIGYGGLRVYGPVSSKGTSTPFSMDIYNVYKIIE